MMFFHHEELQVLAMGGFAGALAGIGYGFRWLYNKLARFFRNS